MQEKHWDQAKELGWKLRDQGMTLPWIDVLIAAVVLDSGCRLYPIDGHFENLRDRWVCRFINRATRADLTKNRAL